MKKTVAWVMAVAICMTSFDLSGFSVNAASEEILSSTAGISDDEITDEEREDNDEEAEDAASEESGSSFKSSEEEEESLDDSTQDSSETDSSSDLDSSSGYGSSGEDAPSDASTESSLSEIKEDDDETLSEITSDYFDGSGNEQDPFIISNLDDLKNAGLFCQNYSGSVYFKLDRDIVVNNDISNPKKILSPITTNSYTHIDGAGHTISGVVVEGTDNASLFVNVADIKNLTVKNAKIFFSSNKQSKARCAVICGELYHALNCELKGDITIDYGAADYISIGGLFGYARDITGCKMQGNLVVNGSGKNVRVGGIAAYIYSGSQDRYISGCEMTGNITATGNGIYASGIAQFSPKILNCKSGSSDTEKESTIKAISTENGTETVCGISEGADSCKDCDNYATLDATDSAVGIILSCNDVKKCENYGRLLRAKQRCGIVIRGNADKCTNHADIEQLPEENYECTIAGIAGSIKASCSENINYGNLNGSSVSGIALSTDMPYDGIAHIKISDCINYGKLTGTYARGIIGTIGRRDHTYNAANNTANVSECTNEGEIISQNGAGIVGSVSYGGVVEYCYNNGEIHGGVKNSGSIAGIAQEVSGGGIIRNCVNNGNLTNESFGGYIGGIVSNLNDYSESNHSFPIVSNCNNSGILTGKNNLGGIIGYFGEGIVSQCSNSGDIVGESDYIGGIAAQIFINKDEKVAEIVNCYNSGSVTGCNIGGIIGQATIYQCNSTVNLLYCYNIGSLNKTKDGGSAYHMIGNYYMPDKTGFCISGCYYPSTGQGGIVVNKGEAEPGMKKCSDDELKDESTYEDWDFDNIWVMGSGAYSYPMLINSGDKQFTITFDPNGGSISVNTMVTSGMGRLSSMPRAKLSGMQFVGWFTDKTVGDKITTSTIFSDDTVVYAHWQIYNPADRVQITPINPENGARKAVFVDDGGSVNLKITFLTALPVKSLSTKEGNLRIVEYNTDTVVYESKYDRSFTVKNEGNGSKVTLSFMYDGLKDNTRYYIEIDDGLLSFEDDTKYAFLEKDDWAFKFGSRVWYLEENGTPRDKVLPYIFDVDDSIFTGSSYEFNHDLAIVAYGLTLSAFEAHNNNNYKAGYANVKRTFNSFGFENFEYNDWYTKKPEPNSIGVSAATKVITESNSEYTVIALPIRGAGYEAEWAGNVTVDTDTYHKGFKTAADQVIDFLDKYIKQKNISGRIKVIVTGYSRAAGTANLVAALLDNGALNNPQVELSSDDIYGFCFEPPAVTTTKATAELPIYNNIYCFINSEDIVPKVPSANWGFVHFGRKYYFNDRSKSKNYADCKNRFIEKYNEISTTQYDQTEFKPKGNFLPKDKKSWVGSFVNIVTGWITRYKFVEKLQPDLYDLLKYGLGTVQTDALSKYNIYWNDPQAAVFIKVVLQVITHEIYIEAPGILAAFSDSGGNPISGYFNIKEMFENSSAGNLILQEHEPLVNFAWLLVCKDVNEFSDGRTKAIYVNCPVDVKIYNSKTGKLEASIIDGVPFVEAGSLIDAYLDINDQKVFNVPVDESYNVEVAATDSGEVNYSIIESSEEEGYLKKIDYIDIAVSKDDEISGIVAANGSYSLEKDGSECDSIIQNDITWHNVDLTAKEYGQVVGDGKYMKYEFVVARAIPDTGAEFDGWYDSEDNLVSTDQNYRFRVDGDSALVAKFKERDGITAFVEEDVTYTGSALRPEVKVYDGVRELTQGKDYSVSYKNNKNAFTFTEGTPEFEAAKSKAPYVTVTGKGNYKGSDKAYFVIKPRNLSDENISLQPVSDIKEDGKVKKPVPVIKYGKNKLKAGTDFTVEYLTSDTKTATECKEAGEYAIRITGKGNYTGAVNSSFVIYSKNRILISKAKMKAIPGTVYTGNARDLTGDIKLTYNKKDLVEGTDYKLVYNDDHLSVGKKSITIIGIGDYTGSRTAYYNITGRDLKKAVIKGIETSKGYTGSEISFPIELCYVTGSGKNKTTDYLVYGTDYVAEYTDNIAPGTAKVTITGVGLYTGKIVKTFKITGASIKKAVITNFEQTKDYEGNAVTQNAVLTLLGKELIPAEDENDKSGDYIAIYSKNVSAGTATVIYKGINGYTDSITKKFTIKKKGLNKTDFEINIPDSVSYLKGGCAPEITLSFGGTILESKKDYIVSVKNNKAVTTDATKKKPTLTITGKGNFSGTITEDFTITASTLSKEGMAMSAKDVVAVSKAGKWKSTPVITDINGKTLKAGTDYDNEIKYFEILDDNTEKELTNSDIVQAGTKIKAVATGKGAYTDSIFCTYNVVKNDIAKVSVNIAAKTYTGKEITLSDEDITLTYNKQALSIDDYYIDDSSYKNNIKKGKATVIICGKGDFGGTKKVTFTIGARGILWWFRNLLQS